MARYISLLPGKVVSMLSTCWTKAKFERETVKVPKDPRKAKSARQRHRMILERRTVMAETPPDDSPTDHSDEAEAGTMRKSTVRLTDSALRYAQRHQLESELEKL